jgi:hypothetical protein
MTKASTLDNQIKQLKNAVRGQWIKFLGDYTTNAFEGVHHQDDEKSWLEARDSYHVSITKISDRWFIYAEEHEIHDIEQPKEGFATLEKAKIAAIEFCEWFENTWLENY